MRTAATVFALFILVDPPVRKEPPTSQELAAITEQIASVPLFWDSRESRARAEIRSVPFLWIFAHLWHPDAENDDQHHCAGEGDHQAGNAPELEIKEQDQARERDKGHQPGGEIDDP
jgi:hypothetical protein